MLWMSCRRSRESFRRYTRLFNTAAAYWEKVLSVLLLADSCASLVRLAAHPAHQVVTGEMYNSPWFVRCEVYRLTACRLTACRLQCQAPGGFAMLSLKACMPYKHPARQCPCRAQHACKLQSPVQRPAAWLVTAAACVDAHMTRSSQAGTGNQCNISRVSLGIMRHVLASSCMQ